MASKAKLATVENELDAMDRARANNLRIWNALGKTDPKHTSGFKRSGGFSGTAIKPIWITQRLTEQFGPCGDGWGCERPEFQLVPSGDDLLVYCTVTAWYSDCGKQHFIYGVGGDQVRGKNKYGFYSDDEAYKKAFTDALGNAFKFIGVGADVHMGLFDDSKYVNDLRKEFAAPANDEPKVAEVAAKEKDGDWSPTALKGALRAMVHNINGCGDLGELLAYLETDEAKEAMEQCERRAPAWWETGDGMPAEFVPLSILIARKKRELEEIETVRG